MRGEVVRVVALTVPVREELLLAFKKLGVSVMIRHSPSLIDRLLSTLEKVERAEGLRPDDPALCQLRQTILRVIADLMADREQRPAA